MAKPRASTLPVECDIVNGCVWIGNCHTSEEIYSLTALCRGFCTNCLRHGDFYMEHFHLLGGQLLYLLALLSYSDLHLHCVSSSLDPVLSPKSMCWLFHCRPLTRRVHLIFSHKTTDYLRSRIDLGNGDFAQNVHLDRRGWRALGSLRLQTSPLILSYLKLVGITFGFTFAYCKVGSLYELSTHTYRRAFVSWAQHCAPYARECPALWCRARELVNLISRLPELFKCHHHCRSIDKWLCHRLLITSLSALPLKPLLTRCAAVCRLFVYLCIWF